MPKPTEKDILLKQIRTRFNKASKEYALLQDDDCILIGLSGGKDSLMLLKLLAERSRIYKPRIKVKAAHIQMSNIPYKSDIDFLQRFCDELGVELIVTSTGFDASTDTRKSPCFLCSWNRRKALFTIAQELGCNKIALGHNMDDFIETMLMNITFQGAFSAMAPMMQMRKFPITVIRPLCLVNERDIARYAAMEQYPPQEKKCPYERSSNRQQMKELLAHLEQLNPEARYNLWGSMSNIQSELLPPDIKRNTNKNEYE
jgi:tRNA(Ile)-lysidine synthetase-like protein